MNVPGKISDTAEGDVEKCNVWRGGRRMWRRLGWGTFAVVGLAAMLRWVAPVGAADNVQDVKRKTAAQLIHDGHYEEGLALLSEVTAGDGGTYGDHLVMARAMEKL